MGIIEDITEYLTRNAEHGENAEATLYSVGLDLYKDDDANPSLGWSCLFFDDEHDADEAFDHYNSSYGITDLLRYMEYPDPKPDDVLEAKLTYSIVEVCGDSYTENPTDLSSTWTWSGGTWL